MAKVTFLLRYKTEAQKKKLEKIADKCGRSANAHILYLIDRETEFKNNMDSYHKTGLLPNNIAPLLKPKSKQSKK